MGDSTLSLHACFLFIMSSGHFSGRSVPLYLRLYSTSTWLDQTPFRRAPSRPWMRSMAAESSSSPGLEDGVAEGGLCSWWTGEVWLLPAELLVVPLLLLVVILLPPVLTIVYSVVPPVSTLMLARYVQFLWVDHFRWHS